MKRLLLAVTLCVTSIPANAAEMYCSNKIFSGAEFVIVITPDGVRIVPVKGDQQ